MLCDSCHAQKASVHLTEIVNGQVSKLNLCEYCAKKKGSQVEQHFGISDLLQGLVETDPQPPPQASRKVKCTNCGMTYDDFKQLGRLGCGNCYLAFQENLAPLLKRVHGAQFHTGKTVKVSESAAEASGGAKKISSTKQIADLKRRLQTLISKEMYEEAARLRDEIRQIESQKKK